MYEKERLCSVNFYNLDNSNCQDCHNIYMTFFMFLDYYIQKHTAWIISPDPETFPEPHNTADPVYINSRI